MRNECITSSLLYITLNTMVLTEVLSFSITGAYFGDKALQKVFLCIQKLFCVSEIVLVYERLKHVRLAVAHELV